MLHDRLELPSTDYKTVILPRELIEQIKQDAFVFTKRKVFNFAVSILNLVEAEGVEPF